MASKSRLGKGLGALFPDLPGESVEETKKKPAVPRETSAKGKAVAKPAVPAMLPLDKPAAAEPSERKKNGGRAKAGHRAMMPALDEMAHPSDMFFGGAADATHLPGLDGTTATDAVKGESQGAKAAQSDAKASGKDAAKKEPELKPVRGAYLDILDVKDIGPNAHQPRTIFDEDYLNELASSIKEVGVLQPIVVRKRAHRKDDEPTYELIMGERRWRASQIAGLTEIPAIVRTTADGDMLRDALLENLHRVALNPLEEAAAYQQMIEEFGLTQAGLSKAVSKSRPQIANTLRLLNLPASVQKKVAAGVLSAGHARALLGLSDEAEMDQLATRIIAEGLSVRSTEEIVALKNKESDAPRKPKTSKSNPWMGSPLQQSLENHFDTKVSIKGTQQHGRIEIVFSSPEDMNRILTLLVGPDADAPKPAEWV